MVKFLRRLSQRWKANRAIYLSDPQRRPDILIDLSRVVKSYKTPAGDFTALRGIDLQVRAGEFVAVIGKSGSGKSTLINMVTGIDRPTMGEVVVVGTPIHTLDEDQMAMWRGYNLGVVFQFFQLLPTLSLLENIMLPMELCEAYPLAERQERAMYLLELVGLAEQAYKFPSAVSGGQQQRAAIARALANEPSILVADEPTGSLDSKTADTIFRLFEQFVQQGGTILMVTHDRDLASRVSRVVLIADGEITDQYVTQALPSLTSQELVQVSAKLEPVQYPPGTEIVRQGELADKFYILVRGEVEVLVRYPGGEEVVVNRLGSGQYFGEIGLLDGDRRTATVRAAGEVEVVVMELDREAFIKLVESSHLTGRDVAQLLSQRQDEMRQQVVEMLLPALDETTLHRINAGAELLSFEPGTVIIRQGDPADKFYLIRAGEVEVSRRRLTGEEAVVNRLGPGQYFGEMGLLRGGKRNATVRAAAEVQVAVIDRDTFQSLTGSTLQLTPEETALVMERQLASKLQEFLPEMRRRGRSSKPLAALEFDD